MSVDENLDIVSCIWEKDYDQAYISSVSEVILGVAGEELVYISRSEHEIFIGWDKQEFFHRQD